MTWRNIDYWWCVYGAVDRALYFGEFARPTVFRGDFSATDDYGYVRTGARPSIVSDRSVNHRSTTGAPILCGLFDGPGKPSAVTFRIVGTEFHKKSDNNPIFVAEIFFRDVGFSIFIRTTRTHGLGNSSNRTYLFVGVIFFHLNMNGR